jgi:hypothetical protein
VINDVLEPCDRCGKLPERLDMTDWGEIEACRIRHVCDHWIAIAGPSDLAGDGR